MAKNKRRQKVKRYHRSFYSRTDRIKRVVGIVAMIAMVLALAWFAAPHVLDWATHTWYTVVKDRDLEAEAAASAAAASAAASSETAESQTPETPEEKQLDGMAITGGSWAQVERTDLADDEAIRAVAQQLKARGVEYGVVTLKDTSGTVWYASGVAAAAGGVAKETVDPARIAAIFREEGIIPVAQLTAFKDPVSPRTDRSMGIRYDGSMLWLDAVQNGNPWLNPYSAAAVTYVGDLVEEVRSMGFEQVVLTNVQFPKFSRKAVLWFSYTLDQCTTSSVALDVPAVTLGMDNLLVTADGTMAADTRSQLEESAAAAGVDHVVICSGDAFA